MLSDRSVVGVWYARVASAKYIALYRNKYSAEKNTNVLPAKSDSDAMVCLQSYQGLRIDRSFVY